MRFGYWLPVFGGWLRNVPDEGMEASWEYVRRLARRSEAIGFDVTLIAELNLNDIKGRSEEHTSELQSQSNLVCRLLLEKKKNAYNTTAIQQINSLTHLLTYAALSQ